MRGYLTLADTLLKLTGLVLMALGLFFWTGKLLQLIPLHVGLGLLLVLTLWAIAVLGLRAGLGARVAAFGIIWGLVVVALGFAQTRLLPGPWHWLIQVLHLAVGALAISLGAGLIKGIRQRRSAGASTRT